MPSYLWGYDYSIYDFAQVRLLEFKQFKLVDEQQTEKHDTAPSMAKKKKKGWGF